MKKISLLIITALFLSSCSQTFYVRKNQSHFDYPNSNVTPIGSSRVTGEVSKTSLKWPNITSDLERQAYQNALSKVSGADVLLNVDYTWKVTPISLLILTIYSGKLTVEGEPASMEIGKQKIQ